MLKYVIIFCIISFCHSTPREVGDYTELRFSQRWPVASVIEQQIKFLNNNKCNNNNVQTYLSDHATIVEERRWVIHGFWAMQSGNKILTECTDYDRSPIKYYSWSLHEYFKTKLKKRWPAFIPKQTDDDLWMNQYNVYGSCITSTPLYYFEDAIKLLKARNMGNILAESGIIPNIDYNFKMINDSIYEKVQKVACVICLKDQDPQSRKQYLLEVQICFNNKRQSIDCRCRIGEICDTENTIIYRTTPETY